jgi:hypothetical protein
MSEVQEEATAGSFNLRLHEIKPATWQMKNAVDGRTDAFSSSKVLAGISNWQWNVASGNSRRVTTARSEICLS